MSLVELRCKRCGRPLGSLDAIPTEWNGTLTIARCKKCDIPSVSKIVDVLISQSADSYALTVEIPLTQLKVDALKAKARGRAVTLQISPNQTAQW